MATASHQPVIDPAFVEKVQDQLTQSPDELSEDGLAMMFLKDRGTGIRYCAEERTWYYYDRRRWVRDRMLRVPNMVREALRWKGWDLLEWAGDDAKRVD
jgi:hypothetical protein